MVDFGDYGEENERFLDFNFSVVFEVVEQDFGSDGQEFEEVVLVC